MAQPRFLIIDDHPLFLEALQSVIATQWPAAKTDVAETVAAAKALLAAKTYDLVLMDLHLPDTKGFEGLSDIRRGFAKTKLAVISAMADPSIVHKVSQIGAQGFIHKSQKRPDILAGIEALLAGGTCFPEKTELQSKAQRDTDRVLEQLNELTPQQYKVLTQVCEAKLNKQIAFDLGVTETTIKAHITSIFKKLGVHSRTQAVLLMQKLQAETPGFKFGGRDAG
jgi:DNA-binding NarL/FixJ family response regulator